MTDWDNPLPELQGLTEPKRYELVQAAKKRMYSESLGYLRVLAFGALMVGVVLVFILGVRIFSDSVWVYSFTVTVGILLQIFVFTRWSHARLRRMLRVMIDERNQADRQMTQKGPQ